MALPQTTMECLGTVTSTAPFRVIEFDNLPQDYTDLQVHIYIEATQANSTGSWVQLNKLLRSDKSFAYVSGYGTSQIYSGPTNALGQSDAWGSMGGATSEAPEVKIIDVLNYSSTTSGKVILQRRGTNTSSTYSPMVSLIVSSWASKEPVTTFRLILTSGYDINWSANTIATIYGIRRAS